jgi:hypothetical protein
VRKSWNGKRKIPELLPDDFFQLSQLIFFVQLLKNGIHRVAEPSELKSKIIKGQDKIHPAHVT